MTLIQKIVVFLGLGPMLTQRALRPIPVRVREENLRADKTREMFK